MSNFDEYIREQIKASVERNRQPKEDVRRLLLHAVTRSGQRSEKNGRPRWFPVILRTRPETNPWAAVYGMSFYICLSGRFF